jgi:hypothetical protein
MRGFPLNRAKNLGYAEHEEILDFRYALVDWFVGAQMLVREFCGGKSPAKVCDTDKARQPKAFKVIKFKPGGAQSRHPCASKIVVALGKINVN